MLIDQRICVAAITLAAVAPGRLHAADAAAEASVALTETTVVRFASAERGQEFLAAVDRFVRAQSPFDRQVRLKTDRDVGVDEYLRYVRTQTLDFEQAEVERLSAAVAAVSKRLAALKLPLPETVWLVKTTGDEDSHAAYCRGAAIVLPRRMIERRAGSLEGLLTHELFHVLSSHNPTLRDKFYRIVGFERIGEFTLPKDLAARTITNPDAPVIEHAIELEIEGKKRWAVPVLLSSHERYDVKRGGRLFDYMSFHLLEVELIGRTGDVSRFAAVVRDGKPVLFDPQKTPAYHERIGRNTGYIIHPEEILADNFMMVVQGKKDVPTPKILEQVGAILAR